MFDFLRWEEELRQRFGLLMVGALAFGILCPKWAIAFFPYISLLLATLLVCSFLKLDGAALLDRLRRPQRALAFALGKLLVLPTVVWLLTWPLSPTWRLALLLLAAMPQGVATPTLLDLLGGDVALGFSWLLASYLLVPLTVPCMLYLAVGSTISIAPWSMAWQLGGLIFGSFVLARIIRRYWEPKAPKRMAFLSLASVIAMLTLTAASAAKEARLFRHDPRFVLESLLVLYALFLLVAFGGWCFGRWEGKQGAATGLIVSVFFNNSLAVVLAAAHLSDEVLALVVLGAVPWVTLQVPVAWITKRLFSSSST